MAGFETAGPAVTRSGVTGVLVFITLAIPDVMRSIGLSGPCPRGRPLEDVSP